MLRQDEDDCGRTWCDLSANDRGQHPDDDEWLDRDCVRDDERIIMLKEQLEK